MMMAQAEMARQEKKGPKRLYAIMYPDCLTDGGGPLSIEDVMKLSMQHTVGLITTKRSKIPKPFTTIIDFSVTAENTLDPYAFAEVLMNISESFEADEYYLVARGFRFHAAANLSGFRLIFPHSLLAELRSRMRL